MQFCFSIVIWIGGRVLPPSPDANLFCTVMACATLYMLLRFEHGFELYSEHRESSMKIMKRNKGSERNN